MRTVNLIPIFKNIYTEIEENKEYLTELDSLFGDGDLGLSMCDGFLAVSEAMNSEIDPDFGKTFLNISKIINEAAPSSLGTILSFLFMGMAKKMKGIDELNGKLFSESFNNGVLLVSSRANSNRGEKTILDSLYPVIDILENENLDTITLSEITSKMEVAANEGCEATKSMVAVHGRAAYHKEKTIGVIDGGAYVGYLMMKGVNKTYNK